MTNMKTLMLGLSAAALTIGGIACAQAPAANTPEKPRMDRPKIDANGDGVITRAEAQAAATQLFAKLDVNKDGKLDQADRELARQQMREKMFAKLDTNGDGSISKAEFMADKGPEGRGPGGHRGHGPDRAGPDGAGPDGMDGPPPPPPGEGAPDGPPSGSLHLRGGPDKFAGKFGRGRGHGGPGFGGHGRGMIEQADTKADTNGDGAISQAEFVAAALKRFDAEDANHDGKVTKEERQAARDAHRDQRKAAWEARQGDKRADKQADKQATK